MRSPTWKSLTSRTPSPAFADQSAKAGRRPQPPARPDAHPIRCGAVRDVNRRDAGGVRAAERPAVAQGHGGAEAQQPSYGAQLDSPPAAMALANTWFCSATVASPNSAGLPPYAAHVEALNWYSP